MSAPSEFKFSPTPGEWKLSGVRVGEIRRIFDELGDDHVIDMISITNEDKPSSGKVMAIYPCVHPRSDEDTSNLLILQHAKECFEAMLHAGIESGVLEEIDQEDVAE